MECKLEYENNGYDADFRFAPHHQGGSQNMSSPSAHRIRRYNGVTK